jgi:GNAT superfamily N-acetyltransferase
MSLLSAGALTPRVIKIETSEQRNDLANLIFKYATIWSDQRADTLNLEDDRFIEAIRSGNLPEKIAGFVAYVGDSPVGCVLLLASPQLGATVVCISELFVLSTYRRRGIGQLLLKEVHDYALLSCVYSKAYLIVSPSRFNESAVTSVLGYIIHHGFLLDGFIKLTLPITNSKSSLNDLFGE